MAIITEEDRLALVRQFENLFSGIKRQGADQLLEFIRKSDFYTAPASTKYHCNYKGGLVAHSMNVYYRLEEKAKPFTGNVFYDALNSDQIDSESLLVIGLLHDICKTYFYITEFKNQKTYDKEKVKNAEGWQVKHDSNGDFIWETVPAFSVDDKIPYGHGEKSVMMIEEYMKLRPVERYAIRWHMGFTEPKESWGTLWQAISKYPVILATMEADLEATYILESEEE